MRERDALLNTRRAAEKLGVAPRVVWELARSGVIPAIRINRRYYIRESTVRALQQTWFRGDSPERERGRREVRA